MAIFGNILKKLGIGEKKKAPTPTVQPRVPVPGVIPSAPAAPIEPPAPEAITVVEVVKQLEEKAAAYPQKLNWRVSIVDLLKLLDIDSSLASRKELAAELGVPPEYVGGDYSKMNMWLHKTVLQKIAEAGGDIPKELID